jgi:hypothetical protein
MGLVPIMLDNHKEQVCEVSIPFPSAVMGKLAYAQKLNHKDDDAYKSVTALARLFCE